MRKGAPVTAPPFFVPCGPIEAGLFFRLVSYRYGRAASSSRPTKARLYTASRLSVDFFQPSFKLVEKTREGGRVVAGFGTAWRSGEVRPTHHAAPKPPRHWRTRKDPLEAAWPRIQSWLEAEPDRSAKELLWRLQSEQAGAFADGVLRTMQRRVHAWRVAAAKKLVFGGGLSADSAASRAGDQRDCRRRVGCDLDEAIW